MQKCAGNRVAIFVSVSQTVSLGQVDRVHTIFLRVKFHFWFESAVNPDSTHSYCTSKRSCPFLYSHPLYKNGQVPGPIESNGPNSEVYETDSGMYPRSTLLILFLK